MHDKIIKFRHYSDLVYRFSHANPVENKLWKLALISVYFASIRLILGRCPIRDESALFGDSNSSRKFVTTWGVAGAGY